MQELLKDGESPVLDCPAAFAGLNGKPSEQEAIWLVGIRPSALDHAEKIGGAGEQGLLKGDAEFVVFDPTDRGQMKDAQRPHRLESGIKQQPVLVVNHEVFFPGQAQSRPKDTEVEDLDLGGTGRLLDMATVQGVLLA